MPLILRGMALIACGRAEGLNCFRDTPAAVVFSFAPGLGVLIAAACQSGPDGGIALDELPSLLCVLLAPSVLAFELARVWGRDAFWNRYVCAFNWCQWVLPVVGLLLILCLAIARTAGIASGPGARGIFICLACYAMWMNWFIARNGLALTRGRAAGFVAAVNFGTMAVVLVPSLLAGLAR